MRLALLALLARFGCSSASALFSPGPAQVCGGHDLYIFWDEKCGGGSDDPLPAAWIISSKKPDPTRQSDLHDAGEGRCDNVAASASHMRVLSGAQAASWGSWSGCCATSTAEFYDATIEEVDQDGSINVSGLCKVEGGRDWVNQVYNVSGTTAGGRRWYTSSSRGYEYEAVNLDDGIPYFLIAGIAAGLVFFGFGGALLCFVRQRRAARHAQLRAVFGGVDGGGGSRPGRRKLAAAAASWGSPPPAVQYGGQYGQYASGQYGQDYGQQ